MLKLKITTPERIMLETEVNSVTLPTQLGQITVLPKHIPLVADLTSGEISYKKPGGEEFFAISGGVVEVKENGEIDVLADSAEFGHEIDIKRAEKAKQRAKEIMAGAYKDEKAFVDAAAGLEKHLARLKVARKHRTRTHQNLESGTLPE
ncbi:MAG: ATP synthase F1 subunit epsilon [Candidatus Doudnabacteria bacterium]|nr:ATP synthase F1 subunit epsilon [Candidatus Doudnabacteria bacterium]